jgi:uncharacterized lipoprotein YddW (UPF0748 family)
MPLLTVTQGTVFKKTTVQSSSLSTQDKYRVDAGQAFTVQYAFRVGKHCLVKLTEPLGTVGKVGYFFQDHVNVATEEIRGVWIANVDSDVLTSRDKLQQGLERLKAIGINTLYPVVWLRGYTLYPSPIAEQFISAAITPDLNFAQRDMLAELIEISKPMGFRVIPWFEYGLMTPPNSPIEVKYPDWIMLDKSSKKIRTKSADRKPDYNTWMNPCHPDVQKFMVDLIADLVVRYDVDGIQLDDHFAYPIELGYDAFTQDLYKAENQGKTLSSDLKNADRMKWASGKVKTLLTQVCKAVKTKQPDCQISISPNPLAFSKEHYLADWADWHQAGLIDELVLQVYRSNIWSFSSELAKKEVVNLRDRIPVAIGILTGLKDSPISSSLIQKQIKIIREKGFSGVVFFFYETLFYEKLAPVKVIRATSDLQRFFA